MGHRAWPVMLARSWSSRGSFATAARCVTLDCRANNCLALCLRVYTPISGLLTCMSPLTTGFHQLSSSANSSTTTELPEQPRFSTLKQRSMKKAEAQKIVIERTTSILSNYLDTSGWEWNPQLWKQCLHDYFKEDPRASIDMVEFRFMELCAERGLLSVAQALLQHRLDSGRGSPSLPLVTMYLLVCGKCRSCQPDGNSCAGHKSHVSLAEEEFDRVFNQVRSQIMDSASYQRLIAALCAVGRHAVAEQMLASKWERLDGEVSAAHTYGAAATGRLSSCVKEQRVDDECYHLAVCTNVLAESAFSHLLLDIGRRAVDVLSAHRLLPTSDVLAAWLSAIERRAISEGRHLLTSLVDGMSRAAMHEQDTQLLPVGHGKASEMVVSFLQYLRSHHLPVSTDVASKLLHLCTQQLAHKWTGESTFIPNSGVCEHCGTQLAETLLSEEQFSRLRSDFFNRNLKGRNVFVNSDPDEVERFQRFMQRSAPFDVVIDGLNLYYGGGNKKRRSLGNLSRAVDFFRRSPDGAMNASRVLIIIREHLLKNLGSISSYIRKRAFIFSLQDMSADDTFLLYAVLASHRRTMFVSHDFFRNYAYLLPADLRDIFVRFMRRNRIHLEVGPYGRLILRMPYVHSIGVQSDGEGLWHVPYADIVRCFSGNISAAPQEPFKDRWLCLRAPDTRRWSSV